jgi:hypothetical protein
MVFEGLRPRVGGVTLRDTDEHQLAAFFTSAMGSWDLSWTSRWPTLKVALTLGLFESRQTMRTSKSSVNRTSGHSRDPGTNLQHHTPMITSHHQVLERIRAEYLEMPDMRLTIEQIERLCGVDREICRIVLDALVEAKFLGVHRNGTYARFTDATTGGPAAKASLHSGPRVHWERAS